MLISPVVSLSSITQKIEAYKFEFDGFLDTNHMISILLSNCTLHYFAFLQAVADIIVRRHFDSQVHPVRMLLSISSCNSFYFSERGYMWVMTTNVLTERGYISANCLRSSRTPLSSDLVCCFKTQKS